MKVAISVPDPVFDAAERLAKQRAVSRNRLFTDALEEYVSRHGFEAVTERLNAVYGAKHSAVEEAVMRAQLGTVADEAW